MTIYSCVMPSRKPYLPYINKDTNNNNLLSFCLCKPVIRRTCKKGDYIVGIGSSSDKDQGKVLWIFRVDEKLTFEEYDNFCKINRNRIPNDNNIGDCVYYKDDSGELTQRSNDFHFCHDIEKDLSGLYCILSWNYIFFETPIELPNNFINKKGIEVDLTHISFRHQDVKRGHRSQSNNEYEKDFMEWLLISGNIFEWNRIPEQ